MSAISLKSITGITSITTPSGVDDQLTLHTNDTTQRVKITESGVEVAGVTTVSSTLNVSGVTNLSSELRANANIRMTNAGPKITFIDDNHNPDYEVGNLDGVFRIRDATSSVNRLAVSSTGNISILNDLDVDGHTNLDNVSIAGITTFSNGPIVPNGQYYRGIINSGSQEKIIGGYISGTDTLRIGESMYLTSNGLGIGENSPEEELHITAATPVIRLEDSDTSRQSQIVGIDGNLRFDADNSNAQADTNISFRTDGVERLRITSAGRLAILNNDEDIDMDSSSNGQFQIDGNGYTGAITLNDEAMFLYHNSSSRYIGIGVNETEVGRFSTGGYEQRFSNTSTYSSTTGSRKGIYVFNSGATTNCYASLELGANNSNGHFGSTILNSIATADTTYSNHFAIQLRHGGNYYERLRITSAGNILIGNTNGGAEVINMVGGGGGILISRSASGSPSDGQTLGDIGLNSYSSSQTCSSADVLIRGQADGAHSGSSAGSALLLFTKPSSTGPGSAPTERLRITKDGHLRPAADNAYDLGAYNYRWKDLYIADAHFSNRDSTNEVDGTWGDWTLQEGESKIFMINNRTGKKYSLVMEEE